MFQGRSLTALVAGAVVGLALTSLLVLRTTQAVFNGTTSTPTNSWATGGALITNDSTPSAVFSTANDGTLTGGQVVQKCIVVTYQGTTTTGAGVKLYSTATGALASQLQLTVEQGSGTPGGGSCASFAPSSSIYSGTVAGLAANGTGYANGVGTWAPSSVGATMTYRFTVTVPNTTAAQNGSATGVFTWEAQA